ncbi:hypothetical protein C1646_662836 [Rhizophagus diaphanus]|nr:hypothetical protein C1646_662836 [Rhizophagus diaphanus] [Rhizophagus sp. MUCL 43196]
MPPDNTGLTSSWIFGSLLFGGYLITKRDRVIDGMYFCFYPESGNITCPSGLEQPVKTNSNYAYTVLPNNTLLIAQMEYDNTWKLHVIDLPKQTNREEQNILKIYQMINKMSFFDELLDELADAVQILRIRLSKYKNYQIDPNSNKSKQKKILISIKIDETNNEYEKDVDTVIKDISYMMSNNNQTPIGYYQLAYLDSNYGFNPATNNADDVLELYIPRTLISSYNICSEEKITTSIHY